MKKTICGIPIATIVIAFGVILGSISNACSCGNGGDAYHRIKHAKLVFRGLVIKVQNKKVNFKVSQVWKGDLRSEIEVESEDSAYGCGAKFDLGNEYLYYGSDSCSGTEEISKAGADLDFLSHYKSDMSIKDGLNLAFQAEETQRSQAAKKCTKNENSQDCLFDALQCEKLSDKNLSADCFSRNMDQIWRRFGISKSETICDTLVGRADNKVGECLAKLAYGIREEEFETAKRICGKVKGNKKESYYCFRRIGVPDK